VTVERDDHAGGTKLGRLGSYLPDHRAVAEVHPVVRPDGDHAATITNGVNNRPSRGVADDLHASSR
jgi:hypothetical protein